MTPSVIIAYDCDPYVRATIHPEDNRIIAYSSQSDAFGDAVIKVQDIRFVDPEMGNERRYAGGANRITALAFNSDGSSMGVQRRQTAARVNQEVKVYDTSKDPLTAALIEEQAPLNYRFITAADVKFTWFPNDPCKLLVPKSEVAAKAQTIRLMQIDLKNNKPTKTRLMENHFEFDLNRHIYKVKKDCPYIGFLSTVSGDSVAKLCKNSGN